MNKMLGPVSDFSACHVAVFIVPRFSQLSLAALIEPLRMSNTVAGKPLFSWALCSEGGQPVKSSSGFINQVDCDIKTIGKCDAIFVVASYDPISYFSKHVTRVLRKLANGGIHIGALDTGGYFLAEAGLLDGRNATTHWQDLEDFQQRYPRVNAVFDQYVLDGSRSTTSGSLPSFDFTLEFIRRQEGLALASRVSGNFIYDRAQPGSHPQAMVSISNVRNRNPGIAKIIRLMEQTLQSPMSISQLASVAGYSERTFHRRFRSVMNVSPDEYYRSLRLDVGKKLVVDSNLSIEEISIATGFQTRGSFTRAFKTAFNVTPSKLRKV